LSLPEKRLPPTAATTLRLLFFLYGRSQGSFSLFLQGHPGLSHGSWLLQVEYEEATLGYGRNWGPMPPNVDKRCCGALGMGAWPPPELRLNLNNVLFPFSFFSSSEVNRSSCHVGSGGVYAPPCPVSWLRGQQVLGCMSARVAIRGEALHPCGHYGYGPSMSFQFSCAPPPYDFTYRRWRHPAFGMYVESR